MVGAGVRTICVEVPGGVVVVVDDGMVAIRPGSRVGVSCTDGAFDITSSSESSEVKPVRGISEMMGRDTGRAVDSEPDVVFLLFLRLWIFGQRVALF